MSPLLPALTGLALLYVGGEALVKGACSLALRFRVSPLVIGLTIVAFGTSAPELFVSLDAALGGIDDISVGNVVGSNVANLALILGCSALIGPTRVEAKLLRVDVPLMLFVSAAVAVLLLDNLVSRTEGLALIAGLVTYTGFTFVQGRRESDYVKQEFAAVAPGAARLLGVDVVRVLGGCAVLLVGARLLVRGAVDLAGALGVSEAVIGLTIVAVGTSLPEFATSVIAARRGQGDIAVGNVIGSNLFNLLGVLGITATVSPLHRGHVDWMSIGVMLAISVLVIPMLYTGRRLSRVEGSVLMLAYAGYLVWLLGMMVPAGRAPRELRGNFEDDYGNTYTITDSTWVQHPAITYRIDRWNPERGYLVARNGPENPYDPDLWTRIDWVRLDDMQPYDWGFCLSAFNAETRRAAEAVDTARPDTPRTGCNGFPYSRMRRVP